MPVSENQPHIQIDPLHPQGQRWMPAQEDTANQAQSPRLGDRQIAVGAHRRTLHPRLVAFTCLRCQKTVQELRYPGAQPRYCSDACKEEATREQTQARVQRLRARAREPYPR